MSAGKTVGLLVVVAVVVAAAAVCYEKYIKIPTNVAYVSEESGGVAVIDLNTLKVTKRVHPPDVAPRGINITFDGKYVIVADKDTADATVFDTRGLKVATKFHVGDNPEFVKMNPAGDGLVTSYEPGSSGGPPTAGAADNDNDENEPPSHVVEFSVPGWQKEIDFVAGTETEGLEFSRDGKYLIVANEAQNTIGIYDAHAGTLVRTVDVKPYGQRPRGVKVSPDGSSYAVTMEASGTLAKLDSNFNVIKTVQTALKPYGVSFDRSGKRIFVAAAMAQKMQVFDSDSLNLIAEIPIGQRCWHFTFTPDDSKILLACGRSSNIVVVDANSYKPITTIGGFSLPWGIVTYPRSYGSLGLP
jgi:DNA-binding beta-propeller fold protein YncE